MDMRVYARGANIVLGAWLFVSAFIWPHSQQQFMNAWIVGLLVAAIGVVALWVPAVRFTNTILAVWLFASSWVLPWAAVGTTWNHALLAIAIFVVSLIPSSSLSAHDRRSTSNGMLRSAPHSA